jgi:hypothetical protein
MTLLDLIATFHAVPTPTLQREAHRWLGLTASEVLEQLRRLEVLGHLTRQDGRWSCHPPVVIGPAPDGNLLVLGHPRAWPVLERMTGGTVTDRSGLYRLEGATPSLLPRLPPVGIAWMTVEDVTAALPEAVVPETESLPPWPEVDPADLQGWDPSRTGSIDDRWSETLDPALPLIMACDPRTSEPLWGLQQGGSRWSLDQETWFLAACCLANAAGRPLPAAIGPVESLMIDIPSTAWRQVFRMHGGRPVGDDGWNIPATARPLVLALLHNRLHLA